MPTTSTRIRVMVTKPNTAASSEYELFAHAEALGVSRRQVIHYTRGEERVPPSGTAIAAWRQFTNNVSTPSWLPSSNGQN